TKKIDIRNKAIEALNAQDRQFSLTGSIGKELEISQAERASLRRSNAAVQNIESLAANRGTEGQNRILANTADEQRQLLASALSQRLSTVGLSGDLALQRGLGAQNRLSSFDVVGRANAGTDAIRDQAAALSKS